MQSKLRNLREIKSHPNNPRYIRTQEFEDLVKSLKDFPEMLEVRTLVINENMEVLGGNMRLKAMVEAGWTEALVMQVDWSEEKQREFMIKDNISHGEYDWDKLANEWNEEEYKQWGLKTPDTWTDAEEEVEVKPKDKEVCALCGK